MMRELFTFRIWGLRGLTVIGGAVWMVALIVVFAYVLAHPIDLASADLGRHLENGRQAVAWLFKGGSGQFLHANTYSYTAPGFAVPNHHWASGMLFWIVYGMGGFTSLSVMYILLVLAGVWAAVVLATRAGGLRTALLVLPLFVPLIVYRDEVRPEVFSFVFVSVVALVCVRMRTAVRWWWLLGLLLLQIAWVNMHIYFFLAPAVVAAFVVDAIWRKDKSQVMLYGGLLLAQLGVSMLNPNGLWGVWYPFTIFQNYGYRVLENQTVWFLWNYGIHTAAFWVLGVVVLTVALVVGVGVVRRATMPVWSVCLALGGITLGLFAVRNVALTAVLVLPLLAWGAETTLRWMARRGYQMVPVWTLAGIIVVAIPFFALYPTERLVVHGLGAGAGTTGVGEFLRTTKIQGPLFNNYDVGGLLIFAGYPQVRVFVDNRPEAYPKEFFSDVYIPMQEQTQAFAQMDAKYIFSAIVFNYHDATPWAQTFLQRILQDPQWVPVYVDGEVLVLVRDVPQHTAVIAQYALPRSLFHFTSSQ